MIDEPLNHNSYHSPLSGCLSDMSSCFYGLLCPCCLNASNLAAIRHENCTVCHCFMCFSPFWVRQIVQDQNNIQSTYCTDCLITTACAYCAICQDSREINWQRFHVTDTEDQ